jgi:hypothetical protein
MHSARIRFETLGAMDGEAIKAQIAQVVKSYSARTKEDDASHRAMAAMRLQDGVRRLLEGGHRAPPEPLARPERKSPEKRLPEMKAETILTTTRKSKVEQPEIEASNARKGQLARKF